MTKEIKTLTGLRGIAALWVVFFHFFHHDMYGVTNSFIVNFVANGYVSVDMFFILSSFVMCLAYSGKFTHSISLKSYHDYLSKRVVRIYPAYFFWLIATAVVFRQLSFLPLFANLLLIQNLFNPKLFIIGGGVFWSLSSEWIMYLIFPFFYLFFSKVKNLWVNLLLVVASLFLLYCNRFFNIIYISDEGLVNSGVKNMFGVVDGLNAVLRCLLGYILGACAFNIVKYSSDAVGKLFSHKLTPLVISLVLLVFCLLANDEVYIIGGFFLLIISLYYNNDSFALLNNKVVYFLGLVSYSMYLIHKTLRFVVAVIIIKVSHKPLEEIDLMSILISLVLLIPLSYFSYVLIEKKVGNVLRKIFLKPSPKTEIVKS